MGEKDIAINIFKEYIINFYFYILYSTKYNTIFLQKLNKIRYFY